MGCEAIRRRCFAPDLLSSVGETRGDPLEHPISLLEKELKVVFADDFGRPNLHGIAIEWDGSFFIAKGLEEIERFDEVEAEKIVEIDLCIYIESIDVTERVNI